MGNWYNGLSTLRMKEYNNQLHAHFARERENKQRKKEGLPLLPRVKHPDDHSSCGGCCALAMILPLLSAAAALAILFLLA